MALFKVNTGTREQEVVQLRWDWEIAISDLPSELVKNKTDRLIVLNRVARSVIDRLLREHLSRVFTCRGRPVKRIGGSAGKARGGQRAVPG